MQTSLADLEASQPVYFSRNVSSVNQNQNTLATFGFFMHITADLRHHCWWRQCLLFEDGGGLVRCLSGIMLPMCAIVNSHPSGLFFFYYSFYFFRMENVEVLFTFSLGALFNRPPNFFFIIFFFPLPYFLGYDSTSAAVQWTMELSSDWEWKFFNRGRRKAEDDVSVWYALWNSKLKNEYESEKYKSKKSRRSWSVVGKNAKINKFLYQEVWRICFSKAKHRNQLLETSETRDTSLYETQGKVGLRSGF